MGGMIITPAQLSQPSLLCNLMCKFIGFWGITQGIHVNTHAHNHIHGLASIHSNIRHETYTSHMSCDIHADKHKQAHTCSRMRVYKHTSRANISTRMHARQAFCKKRSRSDPFARSLSEPFARRLSDPLPPENKAFKVHFSYDFVHSILNSQAPHKTSNCSLKNPAFSLNRETEHL